MASWQRWMLTWLHGKNGCWHGFSANEVLSWLHGKDGCWHDFNVNELLTWLHDKDEFWHGFNANEVLTWLHGKDECCHGFMEKMDVGIASVWMKCRYGLNANRMSTQLYGQRRVLVQLHYKGKWWCDFIADASANIASWQRWILAWLQYKDKC